LILQELWEGCEGVFLLRISGGQSQEMMDTYMDTMPKLKNTQIELRACKSWLPKPDSNQRPDD